MLLRVLRIACPLVSLLLLLEDLAPLGELLPRDVCEGLDEAGLRPPAGALRARVCYDDPCHLVHAQRVAAAPRRLLAAVEGLELVAHAEAEACCGAAGRRAVGSSGHGVAGLWGRGTATCWRDVCHPPSSQGLETWCVRAIDPASTQYHRISCTLYHTLHKRCNII